MGEVEMLGLMAAMVNDDKTRARIQKIAEAQALAQEAEARAKQAQVDADKTLAEASAKLAESQRIVEGVEARHKALDDRERKMGEVSAAINDEKARWEKVRQQVDAEHKDRHVSLERAALNMNARQAELLKREDSVRQREADAAQSIKDLTRRHAALKAAMAA